MRGILGLLSVLLAIITQTVVGQVIVNEVLSNEPGSYTSLEWIELFNNSPQTASLDQLTIRVDGSPISLPPGISMGPHAYQIICRRLFANGTSPGFESVWGDSSGVWGDCEAESEMPVPIEASFSLSNASGTVSLDSSGIELSLLRWTSAGRDGVSWERVFPDSELVAQCGSLTGATPGRINSVTPLAHDLSLDSVHVESTPPFTRLDLHITSRGLETIAEKYIVISGVDVLDTLLLEDIDPGQTVILSRQYRFRDTTLR